MKETKSSCKCGLSVEGRTAISIAENPVGNCDLFDRHFTSIYSDSFLKLLEPLFRPKMRKHDSFSIKGLAKTGTLTYSQLGLMCTDVYALYTKVYHYICYRALG